MAQYERAHILNHHNAALGKDNVEAGGDDCDVVRLLYGSTSWWCKRKHGSGKTNQQGKGTSPCVHSERGQQKTSFFVNGGGHVLSAYPSP